MKKAGLFSNDMSSPLIVVFSSASFHDAKQQATGWKK